MPQFEPHIEQRKLIKLLVAGVAGFAGLLLLVVVIGGVYHYISIKSEDFIEMLQRRSGLQIHVKEKTVGLRKIEFDGITISGTPGSSIAKFVLTTDIGGAQLDELQVRGADINLTMSQLNDVLQALLPNPSIRSKLAALGSARRLRPQAVAIEIPRLRVWDGNDIAIEITQFRATYRIDNGVGSFSFAGINMKGREFLTAGKGSLKGKVGHEQLEITLENAESEGASQYYALKTQVNKQDKKASLHLRAGGLDWSFLPHVAELVPNHKSLPVAFNANLKVNRRGHLLVSWSGATGNARLFHPRIAQSALSPVLFKAEAQMGYDRANQVLTIYKSQLQAGKDRNALVTLQSGLKVTPAANKAGLAIEGYVKLPPTDCDVFLRAMPENAGDAFAAFTSPVGKLGGLLQFSINTSALDEFKYKISSGATSCVFQSTDPVYSPDRLVGVKPVISSFQLANKYVSEYPYQSFIQLQQIPTFVLDAFLVSEDVGFYKHKGFSLEMFEAALRRNLQAGQAMLGASTITMQTAKNIWLTSEKTVARKLQEAMLTLYLENTLPKDRIMEIYINIVEFGPGIYGISNAAKHFFGKHVSRLNSLEAIYLASLLPSPVKRYSNFCNGRISAEYRKMLDQKLAWMMKFRKIELETYTALTQTRLTFDQVNREDAQHCPERGLRYSSRHTN